MPEELAHVYTGEEQHKTLLHTADRRGSIRPLEQATLYNLPCLSQVMLLLGQLSRYFVTSPGH